MGVGQRMTRSLIRQAFSVALIAGFAVGCAGLSGGRLGNILPTFSAQTPVLETAFETADAISWTNDAPESWQVIEGQYVALTSDDMATASLVGSADMSNVFVEADYIREANSIGAGGLVLRASRDFRAWEKGSGYLFGLGSDGASWQAVVIRQEGGGTRTVLPWTNVTAFASQTNRIGAVARDRLLQFYLNGALIWEGLDGGPASGMVGLFASTPAGYRTVHKFDAFVVKGSKPVALAASSAADGDDAPVADSDVDAKKPSPAADATSKRGESSKSDKPAPEKEVAATSNADADSLAPEDRSPLLRPGLLVRVSVLVSGKREVDGEVKRVSANNVLDLPLVGTITVEGVSLLKLNEMLQRRYSEFFINPQVVAEFVLEERPDAISPWGQVVVLGRVRTPGRVNIPPTQDLTLSGAIQQAGGLDTSARATAVRLTRKTEGGKTERITIDFNAIGQHGETGNDLLLKPGDTIFVPEKIF